MGFRIVQARSRVVDVEHTHDERPIETILVPNPNRGANARGGDVIVEASRRRRPPDARDMVVGGDTAGRCTRCEQSELKVMAAELVRDEAQLLLANAEQDRDYSQRAAEALQAKCDQSDEKVRHLELRMEVLQANLRAARMEEAASEAEVRRLEKFLTLDQANVRSEYGRGVVERMKEELDTTTACHVAEARRLETKIAELTTERDDAKSKLSDAMSRCDVLDKDAKCLRATNEDLERIKRELEKSAQERATEYDRLAAEKRSLEERIGSQTERDMASKEKTEATEEPNLQLQSANSRISALEEAIRQKDKENQLLRWRSNASLLGKETAIAKAKQLQQDKEADAPEENAEIDKLRRENDMLRQQMKVMVQTEEILQQMMANVQTEKDVAISLTRKELELKIDHLQREKTATSDKVRALKRTKGKLRSELATRASEEEDLRWKNSALQQNMDLRLKEKDSVIRRLQKEIRKKETEQSSTQSKSNGLEATVEEQFVELEQKDLMIATLREEESRHKSEVSMMQAKIDSLEEWLRESMSFRTPPASPRKKASSNPQSPNRSVHSNPQSPSKSGTFTSSIDFFT